MIALFIFRRDLRFEDNVGLNFALKKYDKVVPIFILTPEQINNNPYKSPRAVEFMMNAIAHLDIGVYRGENLAVLDQIYKKLKFNAIVFNKDFTPYARARDQAIMQWCLTKGITLNVCEDYTLQKMGSIRNASGEPYLVFTPFKDKALGLKVNKPHTNDLNKITKFGKRYTKKTGPDPRQEALAIMKINLKYIPNMLDHETTRLSAHIKFGTVSIREVYKRYHKIPRLVEQLYWREFFYNIAYYGDVLRKNSPNFNGLKIKWQNSPVLFKKWAEGRTGVPIVDAGMRQLNQTGYMHNRARLIVANYLVKVLNCDWRMGEKYFAIKLIDYDPMINNGNWQWVASTGVARRPVSQQTFNFERQAAKYDKDHKYRAKWLDRKL